MQDKTKIDINGKEANLLFDTESDLSLISFQCCVYIGSLNFNSNDISLTDIVRETGNPIVYFMYEICFECFLYEQNFMF